MCSMSRDPVWEDSTICTAVAPDAVSTVRTYVHTGLLYGPGFSQDAQDRVLYVAPVALVAVVGLAWIVFHAASGRGQTHTLLQLLALAEGVAALLLRRRKPAGALASILAVYPVPSRGRPSRSGPLDER